MGIIIFAVLFIIGVSFAFWLGGVEKSFDCINLDTELKIAKIENIRLDQELTLTKNYWNDSAKQLNISDKKVSALKSEIAELKRKYCS